ncbi:hypothetical protein BC829DRAFT_384930 [Chytridium lagenaria]|nr:hypothetical protein BC829DRAFT_384930 [Chytridium lagenaria]
MLSAQDEQTEVPDESHQTPKKTSGKTLKTPSKPVALDQHDLMKDRLTDEDRMDGEMAAQANESDKAEMTQERSRKSERVVSFNEGSASAESTGEASEDETPVAPPTTVRLNRVLGFATPRKSIATPVKPSTAARRQSRRSLMPGDFSDNSEDIYTSNFDVTVPDPELPAAFFRNRPADDCFAPIFDAPSFGVNEEPLKDPTTNPTILHQLNSFFTSPIPSFFLSIDRVTLEKEPSDGLPMEFHMGLLMGLDMAECMNEVYQFKNHPLYLPYCRFRRAWARRHEWALPCFSQMTGRRKSMVFSGTPVRPLSERVKKLMERHRRKHL